MTNTGCLNLRGKDGSQSSITVRCVYLPASFFNACSSDYLCTERLFLQRPFASQMVSSFFLISQLCCWKLGILPFSLSDSLI